MSASRSFRAASSFLPQLVEIQQTCLGRWTCRDTQRLSRPQHNLLKSGQQTRLTHSSGFRSLNQSSTPRQQQNRNSHGRTIRKDFSPYLGLAGAFIVATGISTASFQQTQDEGSVKPNEAIPQPVLQQESTHRQIRLSEVGEHDRNANEKWIVCGSKVYDITDFIESHPGGEVILRACGGSIDPYWDIFTIHQKPEVREILDQYFIGEVHPQDLGSQDSVQDPFAQDPIRDESFILHTAKPCNAETPADLLTTFLTPIKHFFVRNHLWVPQIDPSNHAITFEFSDGEENAISIQDLKTDFKPCTITATLQCSGNRRKHMSNSTNGKTSGLQWDIGAVSTAEFTGVRLCDVLQKVGYDESSADTDKHIHFTAPGDTYSVSIPLATALSPTSDVLLAWDMNGEPITPDHGDPFELWCQDSQQREVSNGWVESQLATKKLQANTKKRDYKCFPSHVKSAKEVCAEDWDRLQSIQETPVQSAITSVATTSDGVKVSGFAFSGGGRAITRVDVSPDGGKSWTQADIQPDEAKGSKRWAWVLWEKNLPQASVVKELDSAKPEYTVRAVDDSYNTQPESFDCIWNFRGLLANAWHRVKG